MAGPIKYRDLIRCVEKERPKNDDEIYVQVVNEENVKTIQTLERAKIEGSKCIFIGDVVFSHETTEKAVSYGTFLKLLKEREAQYSSLDCYLKAEAGNAVVPMNRAYVSGRGGNLVLEADYREFDKNDKPVVRDVFFDAVYGTRTDAIKDFQHVLKSLNLELACSTRDIQFTKLGKDRARLRAKVKGTATKHYDLRNGSYVHIDKKTCQAFGGKW